ncbi:MAG: hypothetical protein EPN56_06935 [Rhodanobacter sp.]|nr:MAG: hypothetical protein EPN78_13650 [Rhodanobacter sp.]TAM08690.1 MAG: hypothetical protein EPN66_12675 [Rhodanobacter sp.]TAM36146.1 MAG: hypothetical protein EPN56_06935 [Rhodanobacter sp.]
MNARHISSLNPAADFVADIVVPARRWIASGIAVLMTSATLAIVGLPVTPAAPTLISGLTVTDFAPLVVTPTVAEQKAAAALGSLSAKALQATDSARAAQLGAQLAMPYYSFDSAAKGSKE